MNMIHLPSSYPEHTHTNGRPWQCKACWVDDYVYAARRKAWKKAVQGKCPEEIFESKLMLWELGEKINEQRNADYKRRTAEAFIRKVEANIVKRRASRPGKSAIRRCENNAPIGKVRYRGSRSNAEKILSTYQGVLGGVGCMAFRFYEVGR